MRAHFGHGFGAGAGLVLLLGTLLLIGARGSRRRVRIRRSVDRGLLGDPAPPADYLDLCRLAGL
jgi:hypothetical protein